jgi:hypothetical protein
MSEEKETWILNLGLGVSSKCDRGCAHCSGKASMGGQFLSLENALLFAREIRRSTKSIEEENKINLKVHINITGGGEGLAGEALLHPDLVGILDLVLGLCPNVIVSFITSGVNPKNLGEIERLKTILKRPYAERITFCVSYNHFEKRFPKRILKTLDLFFRNGVKNAVIKICQPEISVMRTMLKLDWLIRAYFVRWARKLDPFAAKENFLIHARIEEGLTDMARWFFYYGSRDKEPEEEIEFYTRKAVRPHAITRRRLALGYVLLRSEFCESFRFRSEFGEHEITYQPHFLSLHGKAKSLGDPGFPPDVHKKFCAFLIAHRRSYLYLGPNGFYYPSCGCPAAAPLKIGHASEFMRVMLWKHHVLRKKLFEQILFDPSIDYEDICELCKRAAYKIRPNVS